MNIELLVDVIGKHHCLSILNSASKLVDTLAVKIDTTAYFCPELLNKILLPICNKGLVSDTHAFLDSSNIFFDRELWLLKKADFQIYRFKDIQAQLDGVIKIEESGALVGDSIRFNGSRERWQIRAVRGAYIIAASNNNHKYLIFDLNRMIVGTGRELHFNAKDCIAAGEMMDALMGVYKKGLRQAISRKHDKLTDFLIVKG